jgi:hypothetical protein
MKRSKEKNAFMTVSVKPISCFMFDCLMFKSESHGINITYQPKITNVSLSLYMYTMLTLTLYMYTMLTLTLYMYTWVNSIVLKEPYS